MKSNGDRTSIVIRSAVSSRERERTTNEGWMGRRKRRRRRMLCIHSSRMEEEVEICDMTGDVFSEDESNRNDFQAGLNYKESKWNRKYD